MSYVKMSQKTAREEGISTKEPLIPGGYILLSRKLIESKIMKKPPLYLKVWVWLLLKAQHEPYKGLNRGEWVTSIPEIQEAMSWMIGYRKITPTYKQIRDVLDWLRNPHEGTYEGNTKGNTKDGMIGTTKVTHGIKVKIVNYDFYQDPKNYEGHNEGQRKGTTKETRRATEGHNINKNDKNDKNDKKYINISQQLKTAIEDFKEFRKKIKKPMTDRAVELLIDKLNKLASDDETRIAILNQSIVNGWQGVFPLKQDTSQEKSKSSNPFFEILKGEGKL
jgi:hypothetical protein